MNESGSEKLLDKQQQGGSHGCTVHFHREYVRLDLANLQTARQPDRAAGLRRAALAQRGSAASAHPMREASLRPPHESGLLRCKNQQILSGSHHQTPALELLWCADMHFGPEQILLEEPIGV